MILTVVVIVLTLIFISFLNAAEVALVAISETKMIEEAEAGSKKARQILILIEEEKQYLLSLQVMIVLLTMIHLWMVIKLSTMLLAPINNRWLQPLLVVLVVIVVLFIQVVFGRLIPQRLANKKPEKIAYFSISLIAVTHLLLTPITWLIHHSSLLFGRLFGLKPDEGSRVMTEEDIRNIVEESSLSGDIDEEESEMIQNIFDFDDTTAEEIMTHRTEISAINIQATKKEIIAFIQNERFTRFPVYEDNIDHIVGTIHVKDLLKYLDKPEESFKIKSLLRPALFIPDSKNTSELLREMQQQKIHIAIVLDEYGGTAGIVTIEDLIEEIVGNILDEYDDEEEEIKVIND
ncbi:MAG: hemolysin family protein, partial [Acholeplasmataceae bacterium]|nr:hemolysin family protein [Acholeplasmataceae bacterium]